MIERMQSEPKLASYLHARGAKLGIPVNATFELTARCNFDCPMCYVHLKQEDVDARGRELTAAQWIDLARQARDAGVVFVLLTGGEPFVRRDFFEIYHAMKQMGLMISINSNGSMLRGEILRRLIEDPPFRINITLYGGSSETYCAMCGQPAFDQVVENIRALREAGIEVRLNVSITPHNRQDMEAIARKAEELGVYAKMSSYMFPPIRVHDDCFGQNDRLNPAEAAAAAVRWDQLRFPEEVFEKRAVAMKELSFVEESECAADVDSGVACRAGRTAFWMTWDGRMLPCGMMPGPTGYPVETGLQKAWQEIKRGIEQVRLPAKCTGCAKRGVCPTCAAACVTETGRFDGVPEYLCRFTDEVIAQTWDAYQERKRNDEDQ